MQPSYNILAFAAALVVSSSFEMFQSRAAPPDIGRGSFSYDPNSIAQNEDILRLFLRLASHTANRLIYLKNEAKQKLKLEESKPSSKVDSPALRIGLPENVAEKKVAVHNYSGNNYGGRISDPNNTATGNLVNDRHIFGSHRGHSTPARGENKQKQKNLDNSEKETVEVENRVLFNLDKNNFLPHYDGSRITSDVNTKTQNIILPYQRSASKGLQSGPLLVSHIVGSSGFHENQKESNANPDNTLMNKVEANNSSSHGDASDDAGSGSSSKKPVELDKQTVINSSNLQSILGRQSGSTVAGIANQSVTAASNFQSQSTRLINSAQGTASGNLQSAPTKLINSVQGMSSGILQPEPTRLINSVQGLASDKIVAKSIGIINPVNSITSEKQQSRSQRVLNSLGGVTSSGQTAVKSSMLPINLGSNTQSLPLNYLPTVQDVGSKMGIEAMITANGTQADQIMTSLVNIRGNQNAGNNSISNANPIESDRMLPNTNPAGILMNHGASLTNLSKTVSLDEVRTKVVNNPVTRDSVGTAGQIVGGLTGVSSTFSGPLTSQSDTKIDGPVIDTSYRQGNSALLVSKTSGVNTGGHGDKIHDVQHEKHELNREGAVSEADLKKYADQFANALLPISAVN